MSRLDRLRAEWGRVSSRVSSYRDAAVREQQRRRREAEQEAEHEAEELASSGEPVAGEARVGHRAAGEPAGESLEARARRAVLPDVPLAPPALAGVGVPPPGGPAEAPPAVAPRGRPEPATAIPWGVRVAAEAGWRALVLAAVVWVLMQVVGALSLLVMSFVAGLLITALLQPFVGRLKRMGLGRGSATAVTSVGGFALIGLIGWFVVWQVMENVDRLVEQVQGGIEEARDWILNLPFGLTERNLNEWVDGLNSWITDHSEDLTSAGLVGINYLVQFFSGAGIALFVVLFLLYDGRGVWYWFLKLVPAAAREGVAGAGPRAWITLTGYVRGTVLVALIDAVGIGVGLAVLEVPMAVPLGVIVFLSAFVPIVGAIASGALAVVVALVTNGAVTALLVVALVLIVQQIESQILQPFILGRLVRVHALAVVLSVAGGTLLAGIPGAIVAVPLVAVVNTVVGYLRAYQEQTEARAGRVITGATVAPIAPTPPHPPQGGGDDGDRP